MINYLSIDFESWAYPDLPQFNSLSCEDRKKLDGGYVKESAERILKILAKHKTKLTFFVLGELYDWYPDVIEKIASGGHEIGYHAHTHNILKSKEDLINSLEKSKIFLKRFKPAGFRAPTILIKKEYFSVLKKYGFLYDSSVYDRYTAARTVDGITELPVSKACYLPVGSGYFAALLGKKTSWIYKLINDQGSPAITFIHNWQIIKPKKATFPTNSYLLKNPRYLPYTFEILDTFENLLYKFSFAPMIDLAKKMRSK